MWHRSFLRGGFQQIKRALPLSFVLNKRYFSFLLLVSRAGCDRRTEGGETMGDGSCTIDVANGLVLYYHQYSFYSQKVVMALHEKKLSFESHIVDISKGTQYEQWYLQINPRGEVPVLQDTGKIIPDSARIIDYLEDNFSNGDTPRLIPTDQGPEIRQKVTYFRNMIDKLNGNTLTTGAFLHPELAENPKIPFIAPVRRALVNNEKNSAQNLRKYAEQNPEAKEMLLQKANDAEKRYELLMNKDEFIKILDKVDEVLDKVEEELNTHNESQKWWLCTDRFTVADISLTILLERLNQVGLEERFWINGKRPRIEEYYKRVRERDSYINTIPSKFFLIKTIFLSQAPLIIGVGIAAAVVIIAGGWFIVRKLVYN